MFDTDAFSISYRKQHGGDVFDINHFEVADKHQGYGRASAILETLVRVAYYEGAIVVDLNMAGGEDAEAFAKRNGFHIYQRREYHDKLAEIKGSDYGIDAARKIR